MIDIHNHGLYGVDDGAKSINESIKMLEEAHKQGVKAIVYTPHYRHQMFKYPVEIIIEHFQILKERANEMGMHVYLGCEYHVNGHILDYLERGRVLSMASGEYLLTEYSYETEYEYIYEMTQKLILNGYIPVIAHAERYECFLNEPEAVVEIRNLGALIQINADSILGLNGLKTKGCCNKLLKNQLADIVASDAHGVKERSCNMEKCCAKVRKKYGSECAKTLFYSNPKRILPQKKTGYN